MKQAPSQSLGKAGWAGSPCFNSKKKQQRKTPPSPLAAAPGHKHTLLCHEDTTCKQELSERESPRKPIPNTENPQLSHPILVFHLFLPNLFS